MHTVILLVLTGPAKKCTGDVTQQGQSILLKCHDTHEIMKS